MKKTWDKREWDWNPIDTKLAAVNSWTYDFEKVLPYLGNMRSSIQAGGAMGLWPHMMSKYFDHVYTFEAAKENFIFLDKNLKGYDNITCSNKALGKESGSCVVKLPKEEAQNAGCYYTVPDDSGDCAVVSLDDVIECHDVDLIQLDVEGRELDVLKGAERIISESFPVIMIEDKRLFHSAEIGHEVGAVSKYLSNRYGYCVVEKIHNDIIFKIK